jgi:repressor of nif and glnA expression
MRPVFESNYCVSQLVAVAESGQKIGDIIIPEGKIGLAINNN